ncbi:MAG: hypothetical protein LBL45_01025 [Treponema sp.]|nr:hypothetical protein [Treponema sp.]
MNNQWDERLLRVREHIGESGGGWAYGARAEWVFGNLYHRLHWPSNLLDDVVSDTFDMS